MRSRAAVVVAFAAVASACNAVSGASDLTIEDTPGNGALPPRSPTSADGGTTPPATTPPGTTPPGTTPPGTTPPGTPPPPSSDVRDITFEAGSLTGNGFDAITGAPTVESSSPIVGLHAMRAAATSSYGTVALPKATDVWIGIVVRVDSSATTAAPTLARLTFGPADSQGLLQLGAAAMGSSARSLAMVIGGSSAGVGTVTLGSVVHLGIHVTGTTIEIWRADGPAAFPTKPQATLGGIISGAPSKLEVGRLDAEDVNAVFDDIRISTTAMPPF